MARPKGSKNKKEVDEIVMLVAPTVSVEPLIHPLSVDYPNEWTNDIARKINEIISHINERTEA